MLQLPWSPASWVRDTVASLVFAVLWGTSGQVWAGQGRIELLLERAGATPLREPHFVPIGHSQPAPQGDHEIVAVGFSAASNIDDTTASLLADLPNLTIIGFDGPCPTARPLQILPHCSKVQSLYFRQIELDEATMQRVAMLKRLTVFHASDAMISDAAARPLRQLTQLKKVDLSRNPVSHVTIDHLGSSRDLEVLIVSYTDIAKLPDGFAARFPSLRQFEAKATPLTDESVGQMAAIACLEKVSLRCTQITDQGVLDLARLVNLRRLDVSDTGIDGLTLHSLFRLKHLEYLDVSGNAITDETLLALPLSGSLMTLNCGGMLLSDKSLIHIASMPRVVELTVSGTLMTDEGLKSSLAYGRLSRINMVGTRVTDESIEVIAASRTLREVSLSSGFVTAEGIQRLRKLRPRLSVIYIDTGVRSRGAMRNPFLGDG